MINTVKLWDYIVEYSVMNHRESMKQNCIDFSNTLDTSFYTEKTTETDKGIFINLAVNNKAMVDLNVGCVITAGAPFGTVERRDRYGSYVDRESMVMSKLFVDFKFWKSNGNIDIVVRRNGIKERWNEKKMKSEWRYYKLNKTLKITKDNVYLIKGKSIQNASESDIRKMLFTLYGARGNDNNYTESMMSLIYNTTNHEVRHYGFSVKSIVTKNIVDKRSALSVIHKYFDTLNDNMIGMMYIIYIKYAFKKLKHRDLINVFKTYFEYCNNPLWNGRIHDFHGFSRHDKFQDYVSINDIVNTFIPEGYVFEGKARYKLGLHTEITPENCQDYGLCKIPVYAPDVDIDWV